MRTTMDLPFASLIFFCLVYPTLASFLRVDSWISRAMTRMQVVQQIEPPPSGYQLEAPWGLARISHRKRLSHNEPQDYRYDTTAGNGTNVYVLDSGIYTDHAEFQGRASWGTSIVNDGGSVDTNGHGTLCAGIIAASKFGVAKRTNVIAVKVFDNPRAAKASDLIDGLQWAVTDHQTKSAVARIDGTGFRGSVIFLNPGVDFVTRVTTIEASPLVQAVNAAIDAGIQVVMPAGNESINGCTLDVRQLNAVIVGASHISDRRTDYSNWGTCVTLYAPGNIIPSTYASYKEPIRFVSGTEVAAAHVAGLLAYLQSLQPGAPIPPPGVLKDLLLKYATEGVLEDVPEGTPNLLANNNADGISMQADQRIGKPPCASSKGVAAIFPDESTNSKLGPTDIITQPHTQWDLARISHRRIGYGYDSQYIYNSTGGDGITVYVLDDGIAHGHPEFEDRGSFGANIIKWNGNPGTLAHGTHMAGTIASRRFGVAKKSRVVSVKILDEDLESTKASRTGGLEWAVAAHQERGSGASVIFFNPGVRDKSLGENPGHRSLHDSSDMLDTESGNLTEAINAAIDAGIPVVVPAGNGNVHRCRTPWGRSNAIIVGASDRWDEMADYSNVGSCITLFAPGSGVESTWVEQDRRKIDPTYKIRTLYGTGPAAAHVAGLLAYLQSLQPEYLSPADLKSLLLKYALKDVLKKVPEDTTNLLAFNNIDESGDD